MDAFEWLLDSEPAIRWQAMSDLGDADFAAERARVSREGLGAAVLAAQGSDGAWHKGGSPDWLPTLFMPLLLRATGVDPSDALVADAVARLDGGFRWHEHVGGKSFFQGETEPCINGHALALGAYFGRPSRALLDRLLQEQLADGGWNCEAPKSARSSFHSTICVLEGLLEWERSVGDDPAIAAARARGDEYLLERRLFLRRSSGEVAHPSFLELAFPPRYRYDVLRALDYFRTAGAVPDPRMEDAVRLLEKKREHGLWLLERSHTESLTVDVGERIGEPSRWITLRSLRVLRWYRR